jgi:hypothetical protein
MSWTLSLFFTCIWKKERSQYFGINVRSHIYVYVSYEHYTGRENTTILIVAYDEQVLLLLLMEVYKSSLPFLKNLKHLNPQMVAILETYFTPLT